MLGECQVATPLMAQRAAHGALRLAHRRFQPGQGVGIQLAGLRLSGKPQRPSQCQFGHETPVLAFALFAPAASRPGQHRAVRRQRGRQVAPCGHASTVGQRFLRLVLERRSRSSCAYRCRPWHFACCGRWQADGVWRQIPRAAGFRQVHRDVVKVPLLMCAVVHGRRPILPARREDGGGSGQHEPSEPLHTLA
jgi:hypothetical protein